MCALLCVVRDERDDGGDDDCALAALAGPRSLRAPRVVRAARTARARGNTRAFSAQSERVQTNDERDERESIGAR